MSKLPRKDQTPKSFAPEDWREAIARGEYWSAIVDAWVPVSLSDEEEALIERVMEQHPELTRREAIQSLSEAGMISW